MSNANELAFPNGHANGLTKREYFAAMAMQNLASHTSPYHARAVAMNALLYADALLAELVKHEGEK